VLQAFVFLLFCFFVVGCLAASVWRGAFSAARSHSLSREHRGGHHHLRNRRLALAALPLGFSRLLDAMPCALPVEALPSKSDPQGVRCPWA